MTKRVYSICHATQDQTHRLICWKLDRLSRRQVDGISVLADWCDRGVRVVSVTQLIDLRGAVGRMVAAVLFGLAERSSNDASARPLAFALRRRTACTRGGDSREQPRRHRLDRQSFVSEGP